MSYKWFFLILCFCSYASTASIEEIKKAGTIRLATEGAFAPFNFFHGRTLTGFEVELGDALSKKLGLKADWKTYPFDSLLIGLNQNRFDLVAASHGITPEREKAVDFTSPHYCTGGMIIARAGGPKTAADLKGKIVAVQVGTTYLTHVQKIPGIKDVKTFPRDTDCLQNLVTGHVDAWVTDKFVALDAIKATGAEKFSKGDLLFSEKIGMAVAKGNAGLRDAINGALKTLQQDGTYAKLSTKYFGEDIRCQ